MGENLKMWDARLPQAEFAHNAAVNRSTGLCPFQVVYAVIPWSPVDLLTVPLPVRADVRATDLMDSLARTHAATWVHLEESNAHYKIVADCHLRHVEFEPVDFVWVVLTKDRYPSHQYNKLKVRKVGPIEVVERINPNAYRLKLLSHLNTSDVFNVKHLVPFDGAEDASSEDGSDLRANLLCVGENDGMDSEGKALEFLERFDRIRKLKA